MPYRFPTTAGSCAPFVTFAPSGASFHLSCLPQTHVVSGVCIAAFGSFWRSVKARTALEGLAPSGGGGENVVESSSREEGMGDGRLVSFPGSE